MVRAVFDVSGAGDLYRTRPVIFSHAYRLSGLCGGEYAWEQRLFHEFGEGARALAPIKVERGNQS
jgi:hypothetical protein